jgi:hypothetical protein
MDDLVLILHLNWVGVALAAPLTVRPMAALAHTAVSVSAGHFSKDFMQERWTAKLSALLSVNDLTCPGVVVLLKPSWHRRRLGCWLNCGSGSASRIPTGTGLQVASGHEANC